MATGYSHRRANLKDINTHVIPHIPADKWEDLGIELLDAETGAAELSRIKANNPEMHQRCRAMFEKWLLGLDATWNELIAALQNIELMFLADKIEKTFSSMTDVLPVEHTKSETTNTVIISRADEASAEFGILLSKILEVLIKNKSKSLKLLKSICSTLTIKNNSNIPIFSDEELHEIMACVDIEDLFLVKLRNYWRWDEFSVLSIIVSSLNSKKCELLLNQFNKKIDTKMKLAEIYQQCKKQNDFPKGFDKMFAIIKKPFRTITKKEYAELKKFIANNCGVESCAISPFIKASESSLMLEWYIPGAAVAYMTKIASFNNQHFIDYGFIYLRFTTDVILDQRDTFPMQDLLEEKREILKEFKEIELEKKRFKEMKTKESEGIVLKKLKVLEEIILKKETILKRKLKVVETRLRLEEVEMKLKVEEPKVKELEEEIGLKEMRLKELQEEIRSEKLLAPQVHELFKSYHYGRTKSSPESSSSSSMMLPEQSGKTGHHSAVGKETIVTKKRVKEQDQPDS